METLKNPCKAMRTRRESSDRKGEDWGDFWEGRGGDPGEAWWSCRGWVGFSAAAWMMVRWEISLWVVDLHCPLSVLCFQMNTGLGKTEYRNIFKEMLYRFSSLPRVTIHPHVSLRLSFWRWCFPMTQAFWQTNVLTVIIKAYINAEHQSLSAIYY